MTQQTLPNAFIKEMFRVIDEDEYCWIACWGAPRTGKSTLCLVTGYWIYRDWNKVLNSIVFNLHGVLHKLINGEPEVFPSRTGINKRVPYIFIDDFGANCNKSKTQYQRAWDEFKGAFDTLGTMVAILCANMVKPNEATLQLTEKYTHELWCYERGRAKFDRVDQQQSYNNWQTRQKKTWLTEFGFPEVPDWVYKEYNKMRVSLAKEALFNIAEIINATEADGILKRMQLLDKQLIRFIYEKGTSHRNKLVKEFSNVEREEFDNAIMRCKAKGVILAELKGTHYYKYGLSQLGYDIAEKLQGYGRTIDQEQ